MSYATTPKPQAELDAKLDRAGDTVTAPLTVGPQGAEGGEIRLEPGTESTLGTVVIDSYQGVLRIYDQGTAKGLQIPLGDLPGIVSGMPITRGQTLTDVTASRSVGTTYQNTTGRAIVVMIRYANNCTGLDLSSDNVTFGKMSTSGYPGECSVIVPAGHYYKADSGTIYEWWEVR